LADPSQRSLGKDEIAGDPPGREKPQGLGRIVLS
jgi:hypothetical protein